MIDSALERQLLGLAASGRTLAALGAEAKNQILLKVASEILRQAPDILAANREDLNRLSADHAPAFRDRLNLNENRLESMAASLRAVAALTDPVGEEIESRTLANGLKVRRVRAPLGAILMIFESRPNVITEVFSLAFKSGNAIALRGGSESKASAAALYAIIETVLAAQFKNAAPGAAQTAAPAPLPFVGIRDYDRALIGRLLARNDLFDICIPRGGDELIKRVSEESKMPIIKNDRGVCHLYVHEEADLAMAQAIAVNGKTQRPGVCNALETLLVDRSIAEKALRSIVPALAKHGVNFFGCEDTLKLLRHVARTDGIESDWVRNLQLAEESDFDREYLDLKMNIKIVDGYELAVFHIETHGSRHSDAIVTANSTVARRFQAEVDSACVYWNASTRFTDGFELGLGGEIGISTQKLHVRGPVGLKELTSPRWLIDGTGQIRA